MLVYGEGENVPPWGTRARTVALPLAPRSEEPREGVSLPALATAVAGADCVLVDAATLDPLHAARRVHQAEPDVQVVVVVGTEERRRGLERAMLFTPGIGEVWLASPGEVDGGIAARAAGVTRQRRKFRRIHERLAHGRITESPQRTERALISDAYLANLLQVLPDPVFSVDAVGRVLSVNRAAITLLAQSGGDLVGMLLTAALDTTEVAAVTALLTDALERPSSTEIAFRRADGTPGHAELRVSRVAASLTGNAPALFAAVLHDLTERHQAQRQLEDQALELEHQSCVLQDQAAELEQSNDELLRQQVELETALAVRSRFYAAMSHELRTPINAVIGYTGLALDGIYGALAVPLRDALTRSQRAATHLHELVDDVLDLAKIEAGRIELETEPVDTTLLAEDILLSVRPTAEANGTAVTFVSGGDRSVSIVTDPRRVRQILLNLLGNALKFGAGRPVVLRCTPTPSRVAFSVIDLGAGVPEHEQERIFEEFVQLDAHAHRGTGLGLPISRRLAELLGGTLTVASVPGEGSTFTLALPRG